MLPTRLLALTLCAVASLAQGQTAVPVGAGSYASFPPFSAGPTAIATANQSLYVSSSNNVPVPSNKWWTDLVVNPYCGNLWASPLAINADADGVNISQPGYGTFAGGTLAFLGVGFNPDSPIRIRGQGFNPADARALSWGDWTVTFRMEESPTEYMDVTVGRGLPYTWCEFTGIAPRIVTDAVATYFDANGSPQTFPVITNHFGISFGGRPYGVFAPDNTTFTRSGNTLTASFATSSNQFLVVAAIADPSNLSTFADYAYAVPRDSQFTWDYQPSAGAVTTRWNLATQSLQGTETNTIQGWIPHHWRQPNNFDLTGIEFDVARGRMKCATGSTFEIVYDFNGFVPTLPEPMPLGLSDDYNATSMESLIATVAGSTIIGGDTYFGGLDLLKYGQHLAMAEVMQRPETNALANILRFALADWLTYSSSSDGRYFAYYPAWRGLTGFPASFGSDQFNDHHFHYGYHIHAAALLGAYDPTFLADYGPMLELVAREYANWDRSSTNFPFLRCLDIWEGVSQAGGLSDSTRGCNQESSSEAMNSWAGLFLLGTELEDDAMRAAGAMGWAMEKESIREYYFNVPGFVDSNDSNWPPEFTASIVGILWSSGMEYTTYFGSDPVFIHGIQWIPVSPVMSYLARYPDYTLYDFNNMLTERGSFPTSGQFGNLSVGYVAQVDPDYAAANYDLVDFDGRYSGVVYWQTHSTRKLGAIQWDHHMDLPTSVVYLNTNTANYSYVAYNPAATNRVATVYSNDVDIGQILVPAGTLVSASSLGTNPPTLVTNLVPAVHQDGVTILWPTDPGETYRVEYNTNLVTVTEWSNLTSVIIGDGATNLVFDPYQGNQTKTFRVREIRE